MSSPIWRKNRNRSFVECCQVLPVIHIADVEIVLGAVIRRPRDYFFQYSPARLRHLHVEIVVAYKTEENAVAVDALVSHHLFHGNFTSAGALVDDILYEV